MDGAGHALHQGSSFEIMCEEEALTRARLPGEGAAWSPSMDSGL